MMSSDLSQPFSSLQLLCKQYGGSEFDRHGFSGRTRAEHTVSWERDAADRLAEGLDRDRSSPRKLRAFLY